MNELKELLELMDLLKDPTKANGLITTVVSTMKPILYHAGKEMTEILRDYVGNDEWKKLQAQHKWKTFEAYKEAGFTEDQAMSLLLTETHNAVIRTKNSTENAITAAKKGK